MEDYEKEDEGEEDVTELLSQGWWHRSGVLRRCEEGAEGEEEPTVGCE